MKERPRRLIIGNRAPWKIRFAGADRSEDGYHGLDSECAKQKERLHVGPGHDHLEPDLQTGEEEIPPSRRGRRHKARDSAPCFCAVRKLRLPPPSARLERDRGGAACRLELGSLTDKDGVHPSHVRRRRYDTARADFRGREEPGIADSQVLTVVRIDMASTLEHANMARVQKVPRVRGLLQLRKMRIWEGVWRA